MRSRPDTAAAGTDVVAPVDQRDADRRAGETVGRLQSAEAGADDDDAMGFCRPRLLGCHVKAPLVSGPCSFIHTPKQIGHGHRFRTRTIILAIRGPCELCCMKAGIEPKVLGGACGSCLLPP